MNKVKELFKKIDQVERAGGSLKHLSLTNAGFRNIESGATEPNDNQYICDIVYEDRSYTNWDTTRWGALEKSLNDFFEMYEKLTNNK
jgi:hypothetical protein